MHTVASIIFVLACAAQSTAQQPKQPAEIFRSQCASCHTVPDTRFATDRAWLEQVKDTA